MKRIILAWIKKYVFGIQSPSALSNSDGKVKYEYDWLISKKKSGEKA